MGKGENLMASKEQEKAKTTTTKEANYNAWEECLSIVRLLRHPGAFAATPPPEVIKAMEVLGYAKVIKATTTILAEALIGKITRRRGELETRSHTTIDNQATLGTLMEAVNTVHSMMLMKNANGGLFMVKDRASINGEPVALFFGRGAHTVGMLEKMARENSEVIFDSRIDDDLVGGEPN
jgi:hypothetical protein